MKCEIRDCENEDWQGTFNGNLCIPCYEFYNNVIQNDKLRRANNSQAYKNHLEDAKYHIKMAEIYKVEQEYK